MVTFENNKMNWIFSEKKLMFLMASEKIRWFTIWPIRTCTKCTKNKMIKNKKINK